MTGRVVLTLALVLPLANAGCTAVDPPQTIRVSLAGAQIPLELVDSWLRDADDFNFQSERIEPVVYSQHGFQNLLEGECDVACTDRPIEPRELRRFGDQQIEGYRVAFYGFALYVHPENPLDGIFAKHIRLLFQKKITDWKTLGGREGPITLYGPQKATRGGMILMRQARIWFDKPTWTPLDSDAEIVDHVAADPSALGFASIGFDQDVRYLGIRMERTSPPAFPSLEEIESERYGLAKVIYVYFASPPNPAAQAVLDYLFSAPGRSAIESTNVWPIPRERAALPQTP
jgi:phosphate transport system substrate-binding protein